MPLTFPIVLTGVINGTVNATLDDATLAAIRGGNAPPVVVPPVVVDPPVVTPPPPPITGPVSGNGTPHNADPRLRRVNNAPCYWAVYSNTFLTPTENVALNELVGSAEVSRRLQHYTYNTIGGYMKANADGTWSYFYAAGEKALPWKGPGDPPGQPSYGG